MKFVNKKKNYLKKEKQNVIKRMYIACSNIVVFNKTTLIIKNFNYKPIIKQ